MSILFVTATRQSAEEFKKESPLHLSLVRIAQIDPIKLLFFADNKRGLPEVYNEAIDKAQDDEIVVFVHDDVWIDDWHIATRLKEGLERYDVIGVAGNTVRHPGQEAWWFGAQPRQRDFTPASGAMNHGKPGAANVIRYGTFAGTPAEVKLMDGVFLAAKAGTLKKANVRFDPQFRFHHYDIDFCRSCEAAGLRMGTWPIAMTHASGGKLSADWELGCQQYLAKWKS